MVKLTEKETQHILNWMQFVPGKQTTIRRILTETLRENGYTGKIPQHGSDESIEQIFSV